MYHSSQRNQSETKQYLKEDAHPLSKEQVTDQRTASNVSIEGTELPRITYTRQTTQSIRVTREFMA
jgi:hypothetical protein